MLFVGSCAEANQTLLANVTCSAIGPSSEGAVTRFFRSASSIASGKSSGRSGFSSGKSKKKTTKTKKTPKEALKWLSGKVCSNHYVTVWP